MSFDLNLPTVCDHLIFRDLGSLDDDQRTLRVNKPIASSASIVIYASEDTVPKNMYEVVADPEKIKVQEPKVIKFKQPWRSSEDYFEVSYVTLRQYCPKCIGLNVLDDISYTVKGDLKLNRDESLLLQNMEKFTITEINSNPFHTYIGTSLISLLGKKISDPNFMSSKIVQEINTTLEKFKDLQDQYRFTGRKMTDGEILDSVENITTELDSEDPTIMRAFVTAIARSGKSVEFEQSLKIAEI